MNPFSYTRADGPVRAPGAGTHLLAGGTDLLPSIKVGIVRPDELLDVKSGDLDASIERVDGGWRIGALATLADVQRHAGLRDDVAAVTEAVGQAATRQIRERATVGGNLLQRSRCAYHRSPELSCWLDGGSGCPARDGVHDHLSIVDGDPCITTQPSDLAGALLALDASVEVGRDGGVERRPVADHFAAPTDDRRSLHTLGADEIVTGVFVPTAAGDRSTYRKAMDRAAWQFALVGVAAVAGPAGVRLAANGVAPSPVRLDAAEAVLADVGWADVTDETIERAADAAATGWSPLDRNAYKVPLLRGLVLRALHGLT